ncbi:CHA1, partial [Symbiodinium microadriaticum]
MMSKFHRVTPLLPGHVQNVLFKLETLQPSGSFKDRGIGHMIDTFMSKGKVEKIICSSGGNAGHAVATVGKAVCVPVDVYVPSTTKAMMVEKIRKTGANVIIGGENWNAADREARKALAETEGACYIPPYDDPLIWEGNSSIVDELVDANVKPGAVVLSVGGGGLLCGVQRGLERHGWSDVK